jgi:hypothetical protein
MYRKDKLDGLNLMPHKNQSYVSAKSNSSRITGIYIFGAVAGWVGTHL